MLFDSVATNLVSSFQQKNGGSPFGTDVYLRNTVNGATTLLSHALGATSTGGTGISLDTEMTSSGLGVAFQSAFSNGADNLVSNDTTHQTQLFFASFGSLPAATTDAATSITTSGATLQASVNPQGSATTYNFVYGTSSTLSSGTTTTSQSAGSGTTAESESAVLTGLSSDTKYYFEVEATDAVGTTTGSILSFTTSAAVVTPPAATTEAATSITATGATLKASVNPEGSATAFDFVYGTNSTLSPGTTTTTASQSAGSGAGAVSESAAVTGLSPSTKYYFKVVASNPGGTTYGTILNFTTSAATGTPPAATTDAATSITAAGATLKASVNPEGRATTYDFAYGTNSTLSPGTTTTSESAGSGTIAVSESVVLTGLLPSTKYYFKVVASNPGGTTAGTILNFTTSAAAVTPPVVTTNPAKLIIATGATLQASVNPEGNATTYNFVYGTNSTLNPGTTTTSQSAGSGTSAQSESVAISGLSPGTTYYFKVEATSTGGTTAGAIQHFTTPAVIEISSAQFTADVTTGSGQVVLSRGAARQRTFRYPLQSRRARGRSVFGGGHVWSCRPEQDRFRHDRQRRPARRK